MEFETRYVQLADVEVRQLEGGVREFRGYAIRFDEPSVNLGGFVERVAPTGPARAIAEGQDVRHLINHDANLILGRTAAGTTKLEIDDVGVRVITQMPDTSYARDHAVSLERGDVNQMSFAFRVAPGGDSWDWDTSPPTRTLLDFDLSDVSDVTYPAYPSTSAEVRSLVESHGVRAVGPAAVAWDLEAGACDWIDDVSESLPVGFDGEDYAWGYCCDVSMTGESALVAWYDNGECVLYVVPVALDEQGEPAAGDQSSWVAVEWQLVVSSGDDARALRVELERRAGKMISSANAEHVQAIKDAIDGLGEHLDALVDAADLTGDVEPDDESVRVALEQLTLRSTIAARIAG